MTVTAAPPAAQPAASPPSVPAKRPSPVSRRLNREAGVRPFLIGAGLLSTPEALLGVAAWLLLARGLGGLAFPPRAPGWVLPAAVGLLALRGLLNAGREAWTARRAAGIVAGLRERAAATLLRLGPGVLAEVGEARSTVGLLESLPKISVYYARWLPQAAHAGAGLLVARRCAGWMPAAP